MWDKEWGGDWVTGEFKTASLTGSNFPGIVDAAGCRTSRGGGQEKGRFYDEQRVRDDRSTGGWSSRVGDRLSSVVASDGGRGDGGGVEGQKEGGGHISNPPPIASYGNICPIHTVPAGSKKDTSCRTTARVNRA